MHENKRRRAFLREILGSDVHVSHAFRDGLGTADRIVYTEEGATLPGACLSTAGLSLMRGKWAGMSTENTGLRTEDSRHAALLVLRSLVGHAAAADGISFELRLCGDWKPVWPLLDGPADLKVRRSKEGYQEVLPLRQALSDSLALRSAALASDVVTQRCGPHTHTAEVLLGVVGIQGVCGIVSQPCRELAFAIEVDIRAAIRRKTPDATRGLVVHVGCLLDLWDDGVALSNGLRRHLHQCAEATRGSAEFYVRPQKRKRLRS